jgi:tRNA/tmRNA/rRNA uracil-C5-methylase (TrmA/RlmC/RlmD family)
VGERLELTVGEPVAGGACLARHDGRVVFVRHALPGERVLAEVTDERDSYLRADAVEVLDTSPDRVAAPCPHAGPGRCGGCDLQHVVPAAQRAWKRAVVREQFARLAGIDVDGLLGDVEELPGGPLGWRTRITFAVGPDGRPGLHRHRSAAVEPVGHCPLGVDGVGDSAVLDGRWPGRTGVEVVRGDAGTLTVLEHRPGPGRQARGRRPPDRVQVADGPARVARVVDGRRFELAAGGFWQVHPAAAATFAHALLDGLGPQPGERVVDLYAGAGLLSRFLAEAVGPAGAVVAVEADAAAVADAEANLADQPWARVVRARVDADTLDQLDLTADLVVLDPPRAGIGAAAMSSLLRPSVRAVGYLSCDPATLARDVRAAVSAGWRLRALRAFDAFPMTQHVESLAVLEPGRT